MSKERTGPLKNALVIGAGPSGLVTAKYLLASHKYNVTILESSSSEDGIGGTFTNKVYDNTRLVSSKYITAYSDFRMDEDYATEEMPNHPTAVQYVDYLKAYADRFGITKHIRFGCTVVSIKDNCDTTEKQQESDDDTKDINKQDEQPIIINDSKGYTVQYQTQDGKLITHHYDVVSICSGLHNVPYTPPVFGPQSSLCNKFTGQIIHSSDYKDPAVFAHNKRVLIIGSGETAMDIAHRAILHPHCRQVAINVRRGFLSIPHNLTQDQPLDVFITNLFEHAYEHPWIHHTRLRWWLSTIVIRLFLLLTGSSLGFNQWACPTSPIKRGYHIINKSHAAMSHMNVAIKSKYGLWGKFWMWVYNESNLRPIESFHQTEVVGVDEDDGVTIRFDDGRSYEADLIVLATGYRQSFPFLDDKIKEEIRRESLVALGKEKEKENIMCKYSLQEDYLPNEHFIVSTKRPHLGFIGFVRPNVGAIPPMSELQVMWWLQRMQNKVQKLVVDPPGPRTYMVLAAKYQYGVDYGNYMHRVAEDIGAAPTLSTLATSSSHPMKALYTYCIGQSHIPLFRLKGPYASKKCWQVVTGELWNVCLRRGWGENFGLLYMTYLSLLMNLAACALECGWCLLTLRRPKFFVRY